MKKWVNLTPHKITLLLQDRQPVELPSQGTVRLENGKEPSIRYEGIVPVVTPPTFKGLVGDLHRFNEAEYVIVSGMVGEYCATHKLRSHVYGPSTYPAHTERDERGQIIGVYALNQYC